MRKWSRKTFLSSYGEDLFPQISIVIPAFNEEKMIIPKLDNLLEQDYPNIEIYVVNDCSSDKTAELTQNFIDSHKDCKFKIQLINLPKRGGKASAINFAWRFCKTDLVAISDADTLLDKSAIKSLIQSFKNPSIGAVTGKMSMINYGRTSSTKIEKDYRNIFDILRLGESNIDSTPIFNGALIALRHTLFESLLPNTLADDTEMAIRVREKGQRAIFNPNALVYANTPLSFKERMKQKIRRGQGIIQCFARHRSILFNSAYGTYGNLLFPMEFFMSAIGPLLFALFSILLLFSIFTSTIMLLLFVVSCVVVVALSMASSLLTHFASDKRAFPNPFRFAISFMEHQLFLIIALFSIVLKRKNTSWAKIE
jgi:cellulose synthase/poly-beta-1,6-N-acetylglucosamine synthase-like glycosyltransferase